ncbi:MAG: hypothetical protein J6L76_06765 [Clostridia bacterium]|nr:hypothetical protein [Clostridia bacterium]
MKRTLCLFLAMLSVMLLMACGDATVPVPAGTQAPTVAPTQGETPTPSNGALQQGTAKPTAGTQTKPTTQATAMPTQTPTQLNALAKARAKTQIGIWYAIWYDEGAGSIWENDRGPTQQPIYYRPLLPNGTYNTYASSDRDIMKWHIEEISNAGIDFLILDQTNDIDTGNGTLNNNALRLVRCIYDWNVAGNRTLKYCSAVGAYAELNNDMSIIESEAKKLWERYVNGKAFGTADHHLYVDGKPLMIIFPFTEKEWTDYKKANPGKTPYADKFTIRFAEGHAYEAGYWGWAMPKGTLVNEDVACIIPGWYKFNHPLEKVHRNKGQTYKKNWETLLASDVIPKHVVINSFNEYAEHTAVFTARTNKFPSNYPIEKWIDSTGKENPSMYWDMTKLYISKFRKGDTK